MGIWWYKLQIWLDYNTIRWNPNPYHHSPSDFAVSSLQSIQIYVRLLPNYSCALSTNINQHQPTFGLWFANHRASYLVGGFGTISIFPYISGIIIPTDFHIFQRGRSTTNQLFIYIYVYYIIYHTIYIYIYIYIHHLQGIPTNFPGTSLMTPEGIPMEFSVRSTARNCAANHFDDNGLCVSCSDSRMRDERGMGRLCL